MDEHKDSKASFASNNWHEHDKIPICPPQNQKKAYIKNNILNYLWANPKLS